MSKGSCEHTKDGNCHLWIMRCDDCDRKREKEIRRQALNHAKNVLHNMLIATFPRVDDDIQPRFSALWLKQTGDLEHRFNKWVKEEKRK